MTTICARCIACGRRSKTIRGSPPQSQDWLGLLTSPVSANRVDCWAITTEGRHHQARIFPDSLVSIALGTLAFFIRNPSSHRSAGPRVHVHRQASANTIGGPYPIPYRCFYSRNIPNLFMADATLAWIVHRPWPGARAGPTGMMGEVVAARRRCAKDTDCTPREVLRNISTN